MPTTATPFSVLSPPLAVSPGSVVWESLSGCADALALAAAASRSDSLLVIVTTDQSAALRLEQELAFFLDDQVNVLHFPDWETLPYDVFSPLPEIVSQRLEILARLPQTRRGVLVLTAASLMQRLGPRGHIAANTFALKLGDALNIDETRTRLGSVGYHCVSQVLQHGEYAVRGSILDIFPMGSRLPFRIELFDDDVESIRTFDTESQRSLEKVQEIRLFPAREFPFTDESIKRFRQNFRAHFPDAETNPPGADLRSVRPKGVGQRQADMTLSTVYQNVSKHIPPGGVEYYLPLFVDSTETLFDYLPTRALFVLHEGVESATEAFHQDVQGRYETRRDDRHRPALPPDLLYINPAQLNERIAAHSSIRLTGSPYPSPLPASIYTSPRNPVIPAGTRPHPTAAARVAFACRPLPDVALHTSHKLPAEALHHFLDGFSGRVLFVAETAGHREALLDSLAKHGLKPKVVETWHQFLGLEHSPCVVVAPMDQGVLLDDPAIAIVTETQLSGDKVQQRRRRRRSAERELENIFRNLEELDIGSPVVHRDHGVGRYLGLQTLDIGGITGEYLTLEYANRDKLYVPVSSLHLIGRYSGASPETAPLHKLGSEQWDKAKRRALEKICDVAAELLDIQAKRAARLRQTYASVGEEYVEFAAAFPFEETPDQENAIRDVLNDLTSRKPMDRVICGDVGFGKTEVAMRAAFVAAQSGKQVAVLVPTTLLAQQHYQNFRDRFADWPIRIEVLSRFVTPKQQTYILRELANGKVDIVVGTHRLLSKDIRYRNLGLVVVDEEHRFGVRQKEHFKKLRSELDLLALTATPIPRTFNMALAGLRDISIIASPPTNRHPIKTFVSEWNDALIQEACLREIRRGGQIYFLHNKIETMEKTAERLGKLVPEARVHFAHGQMPERELEQLMLDFYHQRFNLLLCTTIIESGIDVPSANTMIIERADLLGLAQLHQLRGRVGRSHHRAYAYLLTPPLSALTSDAGKRLEAIEASDELGAGFMLSSHDLEIRGAGELLGEGQSGNMEEIGFSLYTELLERAVKSIKSGKQPELEVPLESGAEIDLQCPALIPDDYLPDVHVRLVLYKRIASAAGEEELRELQVEMIDRFGLLPTPAKNLFAITILKLAAEKMGIKRIEVGQSGGRLLFNTAPSVDPLKIIQLIQSQPKVYKLDGPEKLRFFATLENSPARLEFIRTLLEAVKA